VCLAEVADRAEVGDVVADDDAAGDIDLAASHDLARGAGAGGVAIQQETDHHAGVEGRLAAGLSLVVGKEGCEVEGGHGVEQEVDQVILGEPVPRREREQGGLVGRPLSIGFLHATTSVHQGLGDHGPPHSSKIKG
jgi:hypothetical protein